MSDFPPVRPGDVLREDFLVPLAMDASALAHRIGMPESDVRGVLSGDCAISGEVALRLARFFGTSPEFWMNLQSLYDLESARDALAGRVEAEIQPLSARPHHAARP